MRTDTDITGGIHKPGCFRDIISCENAREGNNNCADPAIHGSLADLGDDLLHVAAVSDAVSRGQIFLAQSKIGQDLLDVLAHGDITVTHGQHNGAILETGDHIAVGIDTGGISFRDGQRHLFSAVFCAQEQRDGINARVRIRVRVIYMFMLLFSHFLDFSGENHYHIDCETRWQWCSPFL